MFTQNNAFKHPIVLNFFAALAYFLIGKLGAATGNIAEIASLFWPPTGFTFFILMTQGNRVLPGLFFGAWLLGPALAYIIPAQGGFNLFNFCASLLMATASIGQVWLVCYFSKILTATNYQVSVKQTVLFSMRVLASCSIASLVNNFFLWQTGISSLPSALLNLGVWWLGDAIGILLIAPLLFWIFQKSVFRNNTQGNAFLGFNVGIGIVLMVVVIIGHRERDTAQASLAAQSTIMQTLMQNNLDLSIREIETLNHYYLHNTASELDFVNITEPMLDRTPWLENFKLMPVANKNSTAPISFSLAAADKNLQITQEAYDFKGTDPKALVDESTQVQWSQLNTESPYVQVFSVIPLCQILNEKNQCAPKYVLTSKINLNVWMRNILEKISNRDFRVRLLDNSNQLYPIIEWHKTAWQAVQLKESSHQFSSFLDPVKLQGKLPYVSLYDRNWQLEIVPEKIYPWFVPSYFQISIFILGLLTTLLFTFYLQVLHSNDLLTLERSHQLETEIANQTKALRETNSSLMQEISEKRAAQEKLSASENHQRTLLNNIPDPIWFKSNEGEYLNFNKAVEDIFLKPLNEITHKTASDFATPELDAAVKKLDAEALASNQAVHGELWMYIPKFNELRLMDTIKVAVRDEHGQSLGILSIARDITERHKLIKELHDAKEAAESATHAKSRFLANMSHEIRTPLNAVLGYSQLLVAETSLDASQHQKLESILNAGYRLLSLINDILDLSKIESGALQLRVDYFDLYKELSDIAIMMKAKALAKNLSFDFVLDLPRPSIIESDKHKLGQIILNLLGNAIKFTHSGGITFESHVDSDALVVKVSDTGVGIDSNELKELFSAFRQGKAGENTGGTGLGLVISKNIAEHMGGELKLESMAGKGTQAILRLPLKRIEAYEQTIETSSEEIKLASGEKLQVLVAEDDESSQEILTSLLQNIGCCVLSANDGAEALAIVSTEKVDVIFTDIRMPKMDGIDLFHAIRNQLNLLSLPIIAVTASSLTHERDYYLKVGFQEFIGKPYQFNQVYRILLAFFPQKFVVEKDAVSHPQEQITQVDWRSAPAINEVVITLENLLKSFSLGDSRNSKKLFASLDTTQIGSEYWQRLKLAQSQHDLAQGEKIVTELLEEIRRSINNH